MNKQVLHTAVALALGSVASAAFAYDPYVPANTNYETRLSGATASSNTARLWIIDNVCDPVVGDIRVFRRGAGPAFGNDWAVACTTRAHMNIDGDNPPVVDAGETIAVQNVLFRKRDTGGSGFGVTPVTDPAGPGADPAGIEVGIMSINNVNCGGVLAAEVTAKGTAFNRYSCGATDDNQFPDAGFSDIEPNKFIGLNIPTGFGPYEPGGPVVVTPFGGLVFNTPVTKDLRDALQRVQFDKATDGCNPLYAGAPPLYTDTVTPPPNYIGPLPVIYGESEACMPNLTSMEVTSLFSGGIPSWNNLLVTQLGALPTAPKVALAAHLDNVAFAPADKRVQICRRVNGSGTQAQSNAIWLNYPCDLTVVPPVSEPGNVLNGPFVANNSGSNDVTKCLADFNNATNTSGKNPIAPSTAAPVRRWAIGVQSTENNVDGVQNYRFIKIDDNAPTIQNVYGAAYWDYAEQSFQYRTDALPADKQTIFKYLAAQGLTPDDLANINLNYVHKWGQGGWLASPTAGGAALPNPSNPFSLTNPVNSSTRAPFGKTVNICQRPIIIKPWYRHDDIF